MTVATLLACPSWCDGVCRDCPCGDGICRLLHTQEDTRVAGLGREGKPNTVMVALERRDTTDAAGAVRIHLDLEEHDLHLDLDGARELAAALVKLAEQGGAA